MQSCKYARARTSILIPLVATAALFVSRPAAAQQTGTLSTPGEWRITPFAAVGFSGDLDSATKAFGVGADYAWSPRISFEGEFTVLPTSESSGVFEFDTHVWTLTGNVLYHFAERPFVPYGVFGIGYGHAGADLPAGREAALSSIATSSNNFIVNFGGGVERALTNVVGIRGDLRYFFGGDLVPDYWRLGVGVSFNIGRR